MKDKGKEKTEGVAFTYPDQAYIGYDVLWEDEWDGNIVDIALDYIDFLEERGITFRTEQIWREKSG